jgi:DNA-binding MarR family transcriptional regulator
MIKKIPKITNLFKKRSSIIESLITDKRLSAYELKVLLYLIYRGGLDSQSLREMSHYLTMNVCSVNKMLKSLEQKKFITIVKSKELKVNGYILNEETISPYFMFSSQPTLWRANVYR